MGEPDTATNHARAVRRHALRIRTVAVSFSAAVRSARRDLRVGPAERDALIETWRAWSLATLEGYAVKTRALDGDAPTTATDEGRMLLEELEEALRAVRNA